MRRFVIAMVGAMAAGVVNANAADMSVKAPIYKAPPPPAAYNWTGCYVGGAVGYAWAGDRDDETITATGAPSPYSPSDSARVDGPKIGGYAGCNWQVHAFVLGVEGDAEWANLTGSADYVGTGTPSDFYETTIKWQGSARGRLGYAFNRVLVYATGGLAFARVNEHDQVGTTGVSTDNAKTQTGWTVGAGVEYAFTNNLIARIEYRYSDLGHFSYSPVIFPAYTETHEITENAVRVGLAWKF